MATTYQIVTAVGNPELDEFYGTASGNWSDDLGPGNSFPSIAEAEAGIEELRAMGGTWLADEDGHERVYRVREEGQRYPF